MCFSLPFYTGFILRTLPWWRWGDGQDPAGITSVLRLCSQRAHPDRKQIKLECKYCCFIIMAHTTASDIRLSANQRVLIFFLVLALKEQTGVWGACGGIWASLACVSRENIWTNHRRPNSQCLRIRLQCKTVSKGTHSSCVESYSKCGNVIPRHLGEQKIKI